MTHIFLCTSQPFIQLLWQGIVQIFHGMAEHAKRYDDFAKFLNAQGYIVFAGVGNRIRRAAVDFKIFVGFDGKRFLNAGFCFDISV